ncbi:unnamed protein product, partial [Brachionus calyciflorus]
MLFYLILINLIVQGSSNIKDHKFLKLDAFTIAIDVFDSSTSIIRQFTTNSKLLCLISCLKNSSCNFINYKKATCIIYSSLMFTNVKEENIWWFKYTKLEVCKGLRINSSSHSTWSNSSIITLNISLKSVCSIDPFTFKSLYSLRKLDLSSNLIWFLATNTFSNLTNLSNLDLSRNKIKYFSNGAFNGLINLIDLNLDYNQIGYLKSSYFIELQSLQTLSIKYNSIFKIEDNSFLNLKNLLNLDLSNNILSNLSFDSNCFSGLVKLHSLELKSNKIQFLNRTFFKNLIMLKTIRFDGNFIINIKSKTFNKLNSLELLVLQSNDLSIISNGTFSNLTRLTYLDLSYNEIFSIENEAFSDLVSLTHLILNHNKLKSIGIDLFRTLTKLKHLTLHSNNLNQIENSTFLNLKNLDKLSLGFNLGLSLCPGSFIGLENIKNLNIQSNGLSRIDKESLRGLKSLDSLILSWNNLTVLNDSNFIYLTNLTELNLTRNFIKIINIQYLTNLKILDLQMNSITNFSQNLYNLEILNLNKNPIKYLNYSLIYSYKNNVMLQELYLDECQINFVGGTKIESKNYRPVSLTSKVGKLMERIIRDELISYLLENKLIDERQHGFMPNKSCTTNLLEFIDWVTDEIDQGNFVDVIYTDFSKAFDKVSHQKLLVKLKSYGIVGEIFEWIKSFLLGRKQRVVLGDTVSNWEPVTSGVPWSNSFCLNANWSTELNLSKCKAMYICGNRVKNEYRIGSHTLKETTEEKDLGVIISNNLKWNKQCIVAAAKANRILGQINSSFVYLDRQIVRFLYTGLVRTHLEYAV